MTFHVVLPLVVLVVNAMVVRQVRRASRSAAARLGVGRHHAASTSFHSAAAAAAPTVMLVSTSLVYVVLRGTASVLTVAVMYRRDAASCSSSWHHARTIADALSKLVFAYNFYVYVVTGRQFRAELRAIFSRSYSCSSSSSCSSAVTVVADRPGCNDARLAGQAETVL